MTIHRAGYSIILRTGLLLVALAVFSWRFNRSKLCKATLLSFLIPYTVLLWFFRSPKQRARHNSRLAIAPASGKIIRIDEVNANKAVRLSIYLSLLDAHICTAPLDGRVVGLHYSPGQYLVAFHPKASELNEQQTIILATPNGDEVQIRLIAGLIARRICCYVNEGETIQQGDEIGFIKFGSRVELVLPKTCLLLVTEGQRVIVGVTPLAQLP